MFKFIRKLTRTSSHSYSVNIPKEIVKKLGWREKQKLEIIWDGKSESFKVKDWKK